LDDGIAHTFVSTAVSSIPADVQLNSNATIYEGALVDGVKHYQDRHGETPTGNLDAQTINELNPPPAARNHLTSGPDLPLNDDVRARLFGEC
jgi:murein L,D-transpeptidase YcbB/YkuD